MRILNLIVSDLIHEFQHLIIKQIKTEGVKEEISPIIIINKHYNTKYLTINKLMLIILKFVLPLIACLCPQSHPTPLETTPTQLLFRNIPMKIIPIATVINLQQSLLIQSEMIRRRTIWCRYIITLIIHHHTTLWAPICCINWHILTL